MSPFNKYNRTKYTYDTYICTYAMHAMDARFIDKRELEDPI